MTGDTCCFSGINLINCKSIVLVFRMGFRGRFLLLFVYDGWLGWCNVRIVLVLW